MHHSIPAEHAQHDLDLIAGHAAGDLSDSDRPVADELLHSCTSCAELRRDLVAIASATRSVPARKAPRDFRLTETQAASLRRGGWIKTLLRPFAAPRSTVRPMAMAFTSLGLAGLLVANILPSLFGSAASLAPAAGPGGPVEEAATAGPAPRASQAAAFPVAAGPRASDGRTSAELGPQSQPTAALDLLTGGSKSNQATSEPGFDAAGEAPGSASREPDAADRLAVRERAPLGENSNPMFIGSLVLLAIGLALFGLRFAARRVR